MRSKTIHRLSLVLGLAGVVLLAPAAASADGDGDDPKPRAASARLADTCAVGLYVSDSADRSKAIPLGGASVRRIRFVFVDGPGASGRDAAESTTPLEKVTFALRRAGATSGSDRAEGEAPFDLMATDVRGAAKPLSTGTLADGAWTMTAVWSYKAGRCAGSVRTTKAAFVVNNATPATYGDCALTTLVSTRPDRSGARDLGDAVIRGKAYFFVGNALGSTRDLFPASTVLDGADFSLDATDGTAGSAPYPGPPVVRRETTAPFDFAGGTGGRGGTGDPLASAWDSSKFPVGEYTLAVVYTFDDDSIFGCGDENHQTNASFTVAR